MNPQRMRITLYGFAFSHPVQAVRAMLAHKGIDYRFEELLPGLHPVVVRARGFPAPTVPAMELDGERVQGSRAIARRIDALVPDPPLYGTGRERRARVLAAEAWGEQLQEIPRDTFRWCLLERPQLRAPIAAAAPALAGLPHAYVIAKLGGASGWQVRAHLAALPSVLDGIDELAAEGLLDTGRPNAADFQIGATVRALLTFEDLRPLLEDRRAARLARWFPPVRMSLPPFLPAAWLPAPVGVC